MDIFFADTAGTRGLFFPTNLKNMLIYCKYFFPLQYFVVIKTALTPTAPKDGMSPALFSLPQQLIKNKKRLIKHKALRDTWTILDGWAELGALAGRMETWHRLQHPGVQRR